MNENNTNKPTKTNLEFLDTMTDDMIDTSDIPPLTEKFFSTAKWRMPKNKVKVTVEVESEVLEWFKAQGDNNENYLTAALHIYAQAHRSITMG
ncbi:MAG: hypothetical protein B6245_17655 [Desulfobacteraceae bacterium 4572_88]|nr:MAG: hypothetical protein B6245_17655 [Desulfobacteraceae bacterium 4572_88]